MRRARDEHAALLHERRPRVAHVTADKDVAIRGRDDIVTIHIVMVRQVVLGKEELGLRPLLVRTVLSPQFRKECLGRTRVGPPVHSGLVVRCLG